MDWEILKNIRFRDLFFINHQFLASLSVCPFILSICEIEQSGNFLCWTLSISHTSCVQLLQNWNRALPDNRCYLKEYIAQRTEKLYLWFGGLWTQPANYFYYAAEMYLCQWHPGSSFKHLPDEVHYETGDSARGAIGHCRLLQLPDWVCPNQGNWRRLENYLRDLGIIYNLPWCLCCIDYNFLGLWGLINRTKYERLHTNVINRSYNYRT